MSNIVPIQSPNKQGSQMSNAVPISEEKKKKNTQVFKLPSQGFFYPEESPLSSVEIEFNFVTV